MRVEHVAPLLFVLGACDDEELASRCAEPIDDVSTKTAELGARCLPYELEVDPDPQSASFRQARCTVYASFPAGSADCACTAKGFAPAPNAPLVVREKLQQGGHCDGDPCCPNLCLCELVQLEGAELEQCQTDPNGSLPLHGWCYVSPKQGIGSEELVANCPEDDKRLLRIFPFHLSLLGVVTCQSSVTPIESDGG